MALTEEQKERKNEMRKLNRARKKEIGLSVSKEESKELIEEPNEPIEEPQEPQEDPEVIRKRAIADKRRASLALARSKIKLNSQITKEKDVELTKMKEENLQLKELAKKEKEVQPVIPEIVPKKVAKTYHTPIRQRPKKQEVYQEPVKSPTIDYLVDKSYGEQLKIRLRDNMIQNVMRNTFM